MADRTKLRRQVESLVESLPSYSNAEFEAKRAVGTRSTRVSGVNLNVNANGVMLDSLVAAQCSDNCVVEGFSITPSSNVVQNTTNYTVVTLWKRDTAGGSIVQIAEINTANLSANVNAYVPIEQNMANTVAVNGNALVISNGASYGYNVAVIAASGTAGTAGVIQVTLRQD